MRQISVNKGELRKIVIGTVAAISLSAILSWGIVQTAYAAETNQTNTVAASSQVLTLSAAFTPGTPAGYVKANYEVKLQQNSKFPTAKDMSKEVAAEKGAQNLWKLFSVNLDSKTIDMNYLAVSVSQPRAEWEGTVMVSKSQSYRFSVDAVTGEYRTTGQDKYWDADLNIGMDKSLINNHKEYDALVKAAAEKFQLIPGKVTSIEYVSQGYNSNNFGKNPIITMMVTSANGQQAQITFSKYSKELLAVEYNDWLEDSRAQEETLKEKFHSEAKEAVITEENGKFIKN